MFAIACMMTASTSGCATAKPVAAPALAPMGAPQEPPPPPPPSDASEDVQPREPRTPPTKAFAGLREEHILHLTQSASSAEMNLAHMAEARSTDARVRRFARHVLRDYSEAAALTRDVASKSNVTVVPCALSSRVADELGASATDLQTQFGSEFDRRFIAAQVKMHEDVLSLIDIAVMPNVHSRALVSMLEAVRPALKVRLREARAIQKTLGATRAIASARTTPTSVAAITINR